jgi:hypothetical protein
MLRHNRKRNTPTVFWDNTVPKRELIEIEAVAKEMQDLNSQAASMHEEITTILSVAQQYSKPSNGNTITEDLNNRILKLELQTKVLAVQLNLLKAQTAWNDLALKVNNMNLPIIGQETEPLFFSSQNNKLPESIVQYLPSSPEQLSDWELIIQENNDELSIVGLSNEPEAALSLNLPSF